MWINPDTGLYWQINIENKRFTWEQAFEYAKELNAKSYGGYNDWRVPTLEELMSLGNIKLYTFKNKDGKWQGRNNPLNAYSSYPEWKKANRDKGYDNPKKYSGKTFIKEPLLESMIVENQLFWSSTKKQQDSSCSRVATVIIEF
ncbi:MAG: DUF1566 domain-containing protein [Campylobacterota bacterium]|nr:DUF1566 domain-containing protein [Campylobacterota bacterium]